MVSGAVADRLSRRLGYRDGIVALVDQRRDSDCDADRDPLHHRRFVDSESRRTRLLAVGRKPIGSGTRHFILSGHWAHRSVVGAFRGGHRSFIADQP